MHTPADRWLDLLVRANTLKTMPRTGWHLRWVARPEDVAAHSWGAAMVALVLAEMHEQADGPPVDRGRLLTMAILHDLAEAEITDIPRPALRYLPAEAKHAAEAAALQDMLGGLPMAADWTRLMADYEQEASLEARLVRDADRLEFVLQAWVYRRATGNELLDEVREAYAQKRLATRAAQSLLDLLLQRW